MRIARGLVMGMMLLGVAALARGEVSVQGSPENPGYNLGSAAVIRATLSGAADAAGYAVLAEVRYAGSSSAVTVPLRRRSGDGAAYEGRWTIPADAATGLYTVTLRAENTASHKVVASAKAPGFFAYRKQLQISRVTLDKTFYAPGDRIRCEVSIENLTARPLTGLRVEFSNENYPWISTFSGAANAAGRMEVNPSLGLVVLREALDISPRGQVTLPMEPAGTAAFLQGSQVAIMGAGGPARHETVAPPETDRYTIAVWDHERRNLLDMQFSTQVIVREPGRVLPKPYSRNFTHPYNDEIDFARYREFYPPGYRSTMLAVDATRSLYVPGDNVTVRATVKTAPPASHFHLELRDSAGRQIESKDFTDATIGPKGEVTLPQAWAIPASASPGVYRMTLSLLDNRNSELAAAGSEIAVNHLPASLMVFCPHEDDEHPWAGLMRAMVEAGRPVRVVFFTGGDVGECERYFDGHPCDPVRAREFGTVRMEESTEALEHLGLKREQIAFLGLPDGGSGEIWFHHIAEANPFLDIYLAVDHAPYEGMYQPNLAYARDAVVGAAEKLITDFRPGLIAVPHPDERHVDHRTANWFALKACQELLKAGRLDPATVVLADVSYGSGGYKPAPYRYEPYTVYLSGEAAARKQEMGWLYQSQDGNLDEGSKKTFTELPRQEPHYRIADWQQHEGWNE